MALDPKTIGKTIAALRRRAGFSQKGLADRLCISDKAVSKWERGLSVPDIAYLGRLSVLLDIDIDSLLEGKHADGETPWKGVLIPETAEAGVSLLTAVYDKPLVYYLLSSFLLVGIREVLIACGEREEAGLKDLLGSGESLGIRLVYARRSREEGVPQWLKAHGEFFADSNVMTVFGSAVLFGATLTYLFQRAMLNHGQHTLLAHPATDLPESLAPVVFNDEKQLAADISRHTGYAYGAIPVLFSPGKLLTEELESFPEGAALVEGLGEKGSVYVETANRGVVCLPAASSADILDAANFISVLQKHSGTYLGCPEEIAWRRGLIDDARLAEARESHGNSPYGEYLQKLCDKTPK